MMTMRLAEVLLASEQARRLALALGLPPEAAAAFARVVCELATNLVAHAHNDAIVLATVASSLGPRCRWSVGP